MLGEMRTANRLPPVRVLTVDDNAPLRASLRAIFELEDEIAVVGDAADGREAVERAQTLAPDVVLLDIEIPIMNGIEAARQIRQRLPSTKIIFFVAESIWRSQAEAIGSDAFLLKDTPVATVVDTILCVAGRVPQAVPTLPVFEAPAPLSPPTALATPSQAAPAPSSQLVAPVPEFQPAASAPHTFETPVVAPVPPPTHDLDLVVLMREIRDAIAGMSADDVTRGAEFPETDVTEPPARALPQLVSPGDHTQIVELLTQLIQSRSALEQQLVGGLVGTEPPKAARAPSAD